MQFVHGLRLETPDFFCGPDATLMILENLFLKRQHKRRASPGGSGVCARRHFLLWFRKVWENEERWFWQPLWRSRKCRIFVTPQNLKRPKAEFIQKSSKIVKEDSIHDLSNIFVMVKPIVNSGMPETFATIPNPNGSGLLPLRLTVSSSRKLAWNIFIWRNEKIFPGFMEDIMGFKGGLLRIFV